MRKLIALSVLVLGLAVPAVAFAATLETSKFGDLIAQGSACPHGAVYHFVNNQLGNPGVPDGTISYSFTGGKSGSTGPSMNNGPTQHFYVTSGGVLSSAATNLGGKLVLSSVACAKKK
jgi:hypothetical protein